MSGLLLSSSTPLRLNEKILFKYQISRLSEGQLMFWRMYKLNPENTSLYRSFSFKLITKIDVRRLESCFRRLIDRHPMMRACFFEKDGIPYQKIQHETNLNFHIVDVKHLTEDEFKIKINLDAVQLFRLEEAPLFRICIYNLEGYDVLLMTIHHIIYDGYSYYILMDELFKLYSGQTVTPILEQKSSFFSHLENEFKWLASREAVEFLNFWNTHIPKALPKLELEYLKFESGKSHQTQNSEYKFVFDDKLTLQLKNFAKSQNVTLYTLLFAAYNVLLSRYSGQRDIIVGTPISGRNYKDFHSTVGYFVNVVPIYSNLDPNASFLSYLQDCYINTRNAIKHQRYPNQLFSKLLCVGASHTPVLFQATFVFQRSHIEHIKAVHSPKKYMNIYGVELESTALLNHKPHVDLSLHIRRNQDELNGSCFFNCDLFSEELIKDFIQDFLSFLFLIQKAPEKKLFDDSLFYLQVSTTKACAA